MCLQEKELCKSHIIPEFLYKPGYDENGQMVALENGHSKPKSLQHQKHVYEKLLCSECEGFINSNYERYFYRRWYLDKILPTSTSKDFLNVRDLSYSLFKLFHLSILWRASISSLDSYSKVSLGVDEEERICKMLLTKNPGQLHEYQIFGALLLYPGTKKIANGFIASPMLTEHNNLKIYLFVFGGVIWHYVIGDQLIEGFLPISLSLDGSLGLRVKDMHYVAPINRFFMENTFQTQDSKK
jgi:hypothetical protein